MTYLEENEMFWLQHKKERLIWLGRNLPPTDQGRLTTLEDKHYRDLSLSIEEGV